MKSSVAPSRGPKKCQSVCKRLRVEFLIFQVQTQRANTASLLLLIKQGQLKRTLEAGQPKKKGDVMFSQHLLDESKEDINVTYKQEGNVSTAKTIGHVSGGIFA